MAPALPMQRHKLSATPVGPADHDSNNVFWVSRRVSGEIGSGVNQHLPVSRRMKDILFANEPWVLYSVCILHALLALLSNM